MRTKPPYDSDRRPIVIDLSIFYTIEKQIPQKDVSNAYALYCFYYKHSILQSTQMVWCHNRMVVGLNSDGSKNGKGFGWCPEKVARIRKLLQDCGLIRVIRRRLSDGTYSKKTYVWVRWYKSREMVEKAKYRAMIAERDEQISEMSNTIKQMQQRIAQSGKNPDQVKSRVNACSPLEVLNACSRKRTVADTKRIRRQHAKPLDFHGRDKAKKTGWGYITAKKLYEVLAAKRKIMTRPKLMDWANSFRKLSEKASKDEIERVLNWYIQHIGEQFVPKAYSAESFLVKYPRIVDQMKQGSTLSLQDRYKRAQKTGEEEHWTDEQGWNCVLYRDGSGQRTDPNDPDNTESIYIGQGREDFEREET